MTSGGVGALLRDMGLVSIDEEISVEPLSGGVSSDIWLIRAASRSLVVKRPLEELKVEGRWLAPPDRSASEVAWLRFAAEYLPVNVPRVIGFDEASFSIVLEYFESASCPPWKQELLAGRIDVEFAGEVGRVLGQIHAASTGVEGLENEFAHHELFEVLRMEPYLRRTAKAVPGIQEPMQRLIDGLERTRLTLIHGDFSPKNILVDARTSTAVPVVLDAECATWGDPAFDAAFCLSHLAIKTEHQPDHAVKLRAAANVFEANYLNEVTWEAPAATAGRIAALLPALVLARMVGASPVEYASVTTRQCLKAAATQSLKSGQSLRTTLQGIRVTP